MFINGNIFIVEYAYIIIINKKYGGMTVVFKQKTKISKGTTNNNSVRTTVPAPIAQMINVSAGDSIEWTVENINGEISVSISKVVE